MSLEVGGQRVIAARRAGAQVPAPGRPDGEVLTGDDEGQALFVEAIIEELRRRSSRRALGPRGLTIDAELWVRQKDWGEARQAIAAAGIMLHERACRPRRPWSGRSVLRSARRWPGRSRGRSAGRARWSPSRGWWWSSGPPGVGLRPGRLPGRPRPQQGIHRKIAPAVTPGHRAGPGRHGAGIRKRAGSPTRSGLMTAPTSRGCQAQIVRL